LGVNGRGVVQQQPQKNHQQQHDLSPRTNLNETQGQGNVYQVEQLGVPLDCAPEAIISYTRTSKTMSLLKSRGASYVITIQLVNDTHYHHHHHINNSELKEPTATAIVPTNQKDH
jgi:glucan-binding YG repeat protein